ncbi:MAG TPA: NAD(P)/FAD-dependent oxidoreductase [Desulfobacteraceae bacterium]|nr:NAD(P)/FAD-dependent oxidoreductase [Desulfobacteraceae bacterium]
MKNVIIGNSAAGVSAAETIRNIDKDASITIISDEKHGFYSRCLLTYYLSGEISKKMLFIRPDDFFDKLNINFMPSMRAVKIANGVVILEDGSDVQYDKLLVATGASANRIDIPGSDADGLFCMRDLNDLTAIDSRLGGVKAAVVIGGGLVGIKTACSLAKRGIKITVLIASGTVLSQMIDANSGNMVKAVLEKNNLKIKTGVTPKEIIKKSGKLAGISLDNGETIDCQIAIMGKGVEPNTGLVKGLKIQVNSGIVVDNRMETAIKGIYAAGDVAETMDIALQSSRVNAIWPCAVEQGRIAGANMAGKIRQYPGSLRMNSISSFGLDVIALGIVDPKDDKYEIFTPKDNIEQNIYQKLILKDDILCGAILVNDIKQAGFYNSLIKKRMKITKFKKDLINSANMYGSRYNLIKP